MKNKFENDKKIKIELCLLIKTVIEATDFQIEDFSKNHLSIKVPQSKIEFQNNNFKYKYIYLNDIVCNIYYQIFDTLRKESCLEYLNNKELDDSLKELVFDVHYEKPAYKDDNDISLKIDKFIDSIFKPIIEYEIIFGIEHLTANWKNYEFWECQITTLDENLYNKICKSYNSNESIKSYLVDHLNKPIIKLSEFGNNKELVFNRAKDKANLMLNALRTFINFQYLNINEKQTMFEVSKFGVLVEKEKGKILSLRLIKNHRVWGFSWSGEYPEHIENYNLLIAKTKKFSKELQNRINRTISWLGKAVQEENYDDKIVYLCTALETLLVHETSGRKGERIAYRLMLFGLKDNKYLHPCEILYIYELRSIIIHGSEIGIATSSHYSTLMLAFKLLLEQFIQFINENETETLKETISLVKTNDNVNHIKEFLNKVNTKYSKEIQKAIDK